MNLFGVILNLFQVYDDPHQMLYEKVTYGIIYIYIYNPKRKSSN